MILWLHLGSPNSRGKHQNNSAVSYDHAMHDAVWFVCVERRHGVLAVGLHVPKSASLDPTNPLSRRQPVAVTVASRELEGLALQECTRNKAAQCPCGRHHDPRRAAWWVLCDDPTCCCKRLVVDRRKGVPQVLSAIWSGSWGHFSKKRRHVRRHMMNDHCGQCI